MINVKIYYRDFKFWFDHIDKEYYVYPPNELISALDIFRSASELERVVDFPVEVKAVFSPGSVAKHSIKYDMVIPDNIFELCPSVQD